MTTDRRRRDASTGQLDYTRILTRMEEGQTAMTERMEGLFDGLNQRLERLSRDAARSEQNQDHLAAEFAETRRDVNELREVVRVQLEAHGTAQAASVAESAASGAAAGATKGVADEMVRSGKPKLTLLAVLLACGSAVAWLSTSGASILKAIAALWRASLNATDG